MGSKTTKVYTDVLWFTCVLLGDARTIPMYVYFRRLSECTDGIGIESIIVVLFNRYSNFIVLIW